MVYMNICPHEVGENNSATNTFSNSRRPTLPKFMGVKLKRAVDTWIENLDEMCDECMESYERTKLQIPIPKFNGKPENWLMFVRKFQNQNVPFSFNILRVSHIAR